MFRTHQSTRYHGGLDLVQDLVLPKRYQSAFLILTDLLIISVLGGMEARYYQAFILQTSKLRRGNDSAIPGLGSLGSDPRTALD